VGLRQQKWGFGTETYLQSNNANSINITEGINQSTLHASVNYVVG
jgi:hypothetical protein